MSVRRGLLASFGAWSFGIAAVLLVPATPIAEAHDQGEIAEVARLPAGADPPFASVLTGGQDSTFMPLGQQHLLPAERGVVSWWRVRTAPAPADVDRVLAVFEPYSARITVWGPPEYVPRSHRIYDANLPRHWSRHALVFPVKRGENGAIYLRIEGARGYPLKISVRDEEAFAAADLDHVRIASTVLAALAALAVTVLLFWSLLRDRVYLLFFAYLLFQTMFVAIVTGEAHRIPGLAVMYAEYGPKSQWMLATLTFALSLSFLQEFAEVRYYAPNWSRVMTFFAVSLWLLLAAVIVPMPFAPERLPPVINTTILLGNVSALLALVVAVWRGGRAARYVLAAWLPVLVLSIWRTVQLNLGFELPDWLEYAFPAATAVGTMALCIGVADRMRAFRRQRDTAQAEAESDALTGAYNRKAASLGFAHAFGIARRRGTSLAVLFMDLDHFKAINDTLGHAEGDDCLKLVVEIVRGELRQADLLGRWGGEEFIVVVADASLAQAAAVAERMRAGIERRGCRIGESSMQLTVSIGVAALTAADARPDDLMERADRALYAAKRDGRNRVHTQAEKLPAQSPSPA